jgi:hypothetical protein
MSTKQKRTYNTPAKEKRCNAFVNSGERCRGVATNGGKCNFHQNTSTGFQNAKKVVIYQGTHPIRGKQYYLV